MFQKGQAKIGGRQAGTPNKITETARQIAAGVLTPQVFKRWHKLALAGTLEPSIVKLLLYYLYGRPRYEVQVDTPAPPGQPFRKVLEAMTREEREMFFRAMDRAQEGPRSVPPA